MLTTVIRKEHKNDWEKRTALIPFDVAELVKKGFPISVELSKIRIYSDTDYQLMNVATDGCPEKGEFIVGIKEPAVASIKPNQVHLAFSHTIKGQDYNMVLLQKFIDQKATLIDYEPIVDSNGKRTIAFGRFAGIAGAIDSFFVAGEKYLARNEISCLSQIKQTWQYASIDKVKQHFKTIDINQGEPVRVLVVGSGNVGKGSEEVCQWLGLPEIEIQQLFDGDIPQGSWYAVANSRHINRRKDGKTFDAVVRNLEIIGEASKNIPKTIRVRYSEIEWAEIAGMRDVIIHRYFGLNVEVVWDVLQNELPKLAKNVQEIIDVEKGAPND